MDCLGKVGLNGPVSHRKPTDARTALSIFLLTHTDASGHCRLLAIPCRLVHPPPQFSPASSPEKRMAAAAAVENGECVRVPRPTNPMVTPLLTDLYQFTMAYAYWKAGKHLDRAVSEP